MNELTSALSKSYQPKLVITVYAAEKGTFGEDDFYLESHNINENGQVLEGKPLLQETISDIIELFSSNQKDKSILSGTVPDQLLYYEPQAGGKYRMVWFKPAEVRFIHFAAALKIPSGKTWVPAMLYSVNRDKLSVFALKSNTRPKSNSKPFRAPFHNVSDNGDVCLGSASVRKPADQSFHSAIKYWEDLFWLSEFSHLNGSSNPTKTALDKIWKRLVAKKTPKIKWSSLNELRPMNRATIKNLIS